MPTAAPIHVNLLRSLLTATGPIGLDELAAALGTSTRHIHRQLEALRGVGCVIDHHPQRGIELSATSPACWSDYIEHRHTGRIGRKLTVYGVTASTQDAARRLVHRNTASHDGHVIIADHQTAGRGRLGRRWLSRPGSALLLTAIVDARGATADRIVVGACCAAAEAVEQACGLTVQARWPNDLLVDGGKLAGILVEMIGATALIGIGLNVLDKPRITAGSGPAPPKADSTTTGVSGPATCLADHGAAADRLLLLDVLLGRLERSLRHTEDRQLHDAWRSRSSLIDQRVTVQTDGRRLSGRVVDLDPAHGLMLQVDGGAVALLPAATTSLVAAGP